VTREEDLAARLVSVGAGQCRRLGGRREPNRNRVRRRW